MNLLPYLPRVAKHGNGQNLTKKPIQATVSCKNKFWLKNAKKMRCQQYTSPPLPIQSCWFKFRKRFCIASNFNKGGGEGNLMHRIKETPPLEPQYGTMSQVFVQLVVVPIRTEIKVIHLRWVARWFISISVNARNCRSTQTHASPGQNSGSLCLFDFILSGHKD